MKQKILLLLFVLLGAVQTLSAKEPYYVVSNGCRTVTLYYDDNKESRKGMDLAGFAMEYQDMYYYSVAYISELVIDASFADYRTSSMTAWFYRWSGLRTIRGMENLNTSEVRFMEGLFQGCSSLEHIDLSHFNTENVTTMNGLFADCSSLSSLDLSSFNTSNVTNMGGMFACCSKLSSIDVSMFNTAHVTVMDGMFTDCKALTNLDLTSFNTTSVTSMAGMFSNCSYLETIDLSSFNTSAVTNMGEMFSNCSRLLTIYADEVKWSIAALDSYGGIDMFKDCERLRGGIETSYNYAQKADATYAYVDTPIRMGYLTQKNGGSGGVPEPYAVLTCDNTMLTFCYDGNKESRGGMDIGPFTAEDIRWGGHAADISAVVFEEAFANARPTSTGYWFYNLKKLKTITGLKYLNTEEVTDMSYMFAGVPGLDKLDLSTLNTSKVTNMSRMFENSDGLSELKLYGFNTSNVTDMSYMFSGLNYLFELDLSDFNTSNVTNMAGMFSGCSSLYRVFVNENLWSTSAVSSSTDMFDGCNDISGAKGTRLDWDHLDATYARVDKSDQPGYLHPLYPSPYALLNGSVLTFYYGYRNRVEGAMGVGPFNDLEYVSWYRQKKNITKVVFDETFANCTTLTSTSYWFASCGNLTSVSAMENLKTDNVKDMSAMFLACSRLKDIDLSHLNTSNVTNMHNMFALCSALETIDLSNFDTSSAVDVGSLFRECSKLKTIDVSHFDTRNVTDFSSMFSYCTALTTIYCDNAWNNVTSAYMFSNCKQLKGAIAFDSSKMDAAYANPWSGYFTAKTQTKCTIPVISVADGKLAIDCATEGVEFVTTMSKSATGSELTLDDTYTFSVKATKEGLEDSEVATAEVKLVDNNSGKFEAADVNEDGRVTVTDAVTVVGLILEQGSESE